MSNLPPPYPGDQTPSFGFYEPPADNAAKLVRLAVIFNYVSVGLDGALFLAGLGIGAVIAAAPDLAPRNPGDPPTWLIAVIYLGVGLLACALGAVKFIATRKFHLRRPNAWGWGLTAGILGCAQLLCGSCCCLQVAAGVYTVVILCFDNVRQYLTSS